MTGEVQIRRGSCDDAAALAEVLHDAVRNGPSLYNEAQRAAWSPAPMTEAEATARIDGHKVFVAVDARGAAVGFMTLADHWYVDLAYIRPGHQRAGVFRRLFAPIQASAMAAGADRLWTNASLMARPAFEAVGFVVVAAETVEVRGQRFDRFEMTKGL